MAVLEVALVLEPEDDVVPVASKFSLTDGRVKLRVEEEPEIDLEPELLELLAREALLLGSGRQADQ